MSQPSKITVYSPSGGSMEIDDTPQRRAWAVGKGYVLDKPPKPERPSPTPRPSQSSSGGE